MPVAAYRMPGKLANKITDIFSHQATEASEPGSARNTALVTGSVALGAYLTGAVIRLARRARRPLPETLPPCLEATVRAQELMEGSARFYERPGVGVPLVLLHSFNAAASSFEMQPIFEHYARTTARPLYALEWFGFGLSDRPPVHYRPELYQRQLRRFLSEYLHEPAEVVALSLGGEYAAVVACEATFLIRKLVLLSPTGLAPGAGSSLVQRALVGLVYGAGAFELLFYRLARRETLRRFYARQVFGQDAQVPEALVDYAYRTAHVLGAHYAPRRFIDGSLFLGEQARRAYARLPIPTLMTAPEDAGALVQDFDGLADVQARNAPRVQVHRLPTGLMPQWEDPDALFAVLDDFLG